LRNTSTASAHALPRPASTNVPLERITRLEEAFEAHGYFVRATAIPGDEELWAATLAAGFAKVEATLAHVQATYSARGRSKRAMALLHSSLPCPTWGVELAEG
jgi:hypothetical protein